ncbi:TetR-like C-terminal domain-containing protein [Arthrobacter sp. JCM 19049]|uniref:TetR-like C-terminal domain-containing protein n=1 Tax=Arthrobacter sp. JCM 19049 TaxID=1460643 RepID=UPI000A92D711|nr:TetR-like C-terminal domain-containing protein [Arthrobacter sp. JCM 19049]
MLREDLIQLTAIWFAQDPMRDAIFVNLLAALPSDEQLHELYMANIATPRAHLVHTVVEQARAAGSWARSPAPSPPGASCRPWFPPSGGRTPPGGPRLCGKRGGRSNPARDASPEVAPPPGCRRCRSSPRHRIAINETAQYR